MSIATSKRSVLSICAAATLLAGCTLRQAQGDTQLAQGDTQLAQGDTQPPLAAPGGIRPSGRASWMARNATGAKALLYMSNGGDAVWVFDYSNDRQVGDLTGLPEPTGECVDVKGDVFIVIASGGELVEYARGATTPLATYPTQGSAIGCAVDKQNDLAAVDSSPGRVCVWKHERGKPTCTLGSGLCDDIGPPAYDDKGNLIFEAGGNGSAGVCALLSGTSKIATLDYNGLSSCCGGAALWDGKFIALTILKQVRGRFLTRIVRTTLSGTTLTSHGKTHLLDNCEGYTTDVATPFVVGVKNTPVNDEQGKVVIGGDSACDAFTALGFWHYPKGGARYKSVGGYFVPKGEVVSFKPSP